MQSLASVSGTGGSVLRFFNATREYCQFAIAEQDGTFTQGRQPIELCEHVFD
jgi:hypothetical protein